MDLGGVWGLQIQNRKPGGAEVVLEAEAGVDTKVAEGRIRREKTVQRGEQESHHGTKPERSRRKKMGQGEEMLLVEGEQKNQMFMKSMEEQLFHHLQNSTNRSTPKSVVLACRRLSVSGDIEIMLNMHAFPCKGNDQIGWS